MGDPLTTEDLYGTSAPKGEQKLPEKPLEYEETPIIDPINSTPNSSDSSNEQSSNSPSNDIGNSNDTPKLTPPHSLPRMPADVPSSNPRSHTGLNVLAFIILFIAGIWLSSAIRPYLPSGFSDSLGLSPQKIPVSPTPSVGNTLPKTTPEEITWKSYDVLSGISKKPISGISYMLPATILPPICDGSGCASQGTYLPGGTRFTIAARGSGQSLRDYRGTAISDVNGVTFTTKAITIAGKQAMEFTGTFTGRTISGYAFTTMRGVMIPLTDSTSVEFNHFVPSGIVADFQSDDALFDTIIGKIVLNGADQSQKGAVIASPTLFVPIAVNSGTITISPTPTRVASQAGVLSPSKTQ